MKIAVSGKGGVGKTTFASLLIRSFNEMNKRVLAIDADPDANLAAAVGIQNAEQIPPISEMKDMIFERTEAKPGTIGGFFKLNPKVDDLPDTLSARFENIKLMRLGGIQKGGAGCICPESALLRALVMHVVLARDEVVVMDMEAGIEHLGRGTAKSVDQLIIVVEPGRRSIETAEHIRKLASEIGLDKLSVVGNKIRNPKDIEFLENNIQDLIISGFLPYNDDFIDADLSGKAPYDAAPAVRAAVIDIARKIGTDEQ